MGMGGSLTVVLALSGVVLVGCTGTATPTVAAARAPSAPVTSQPNIAAAPSAAPFPSVVRVLGRSRSDAVALLADRVQLAINRAGAAGLASMLFDLEHGVVAVYWAGPIPPLVASVRPDVPTVRVRFVQARYGLRQMQDAADRLINAQALSQLDSALAVTSVDMDPKGRGILVQVTYADHARWGHAPPVPADYVAAIGRLAEPVAVLRVEPSTDGPVLL
jgi:hypothetical protein